MRYDSPSRDRYHGMMTHAERVLDDAADNAAAEIRRAEQLLVEVEANEEPATEEEIEELRAYVMGPARTPEWEAVIARIDEGELTWRQVVEGKLWRDAGVNAAYESSVHISPSPGGGRPPNEPIRAAPATSSDRTTQVDEPEEDFEYLDPLAE